LAAVAEGEHVAGVVGAAAVALWAAAAAAAAALWAAAAAAVGGYAGEARAAGV
jgi:hypothetical protein